MVGITEISAGLNSLKAAKDIVKALHAIQAGADLNEIKISLQGHILEAQEGLFAAQEAQSASARRIADLEQEIVRLKDWSAERERYHLVNVCRGSFAYMPKPGMEKGQPAHWLCTNCFDHGKKSYLSFKGQDKSRSGGNGDESTYGCDTCKGSIKVNWRRKPVYPSDPNDD